MKPSWRRCARSKRLAPPHLVILHGATDANALADDLHLLGLIQSVFGAGPVYIEFGNEEDLAGVDVTRYSDAWNQVVPQLKTQAPTYKFIGPVTYTYNPAYVAAFDKHANPRPDFNSWHEYVCNPTNTDSYCMEHINNWNTHIALTNDAVKAAIGTTLPFMITEWNLDPQQDPRYSTPRSFSHGRRRRSRRWRPTPLMGCSPPCSTARRTIRASI